MWESVRHCSPTSWRPSPTQWALTERNGAPLTAVLLCLVALSPCSRGRNRGGQSGDHAAIREFQQSGLSRYWRKEQLVSVVLYDNREGGGWLGRTRAIERRETCKQVLQNMQIR